jgi:hypothetical protein
MEASARPNGHFCSFQEDGVIQNRAGGRGQPAYATLGIYNNEQGNYLATYKTGHKFSAFCADETNGRTIAYFADRSTPLGYLPLTPGILTGGNSVGLAYIATSITCISLSSFSVF